MWYKIIFAGLMMGLSHWTFSQELTPEQRDTLNALYGNYIDGDSPGLAIGIVGHGEVLYEAYCGYAELEHRVEVSAKTRFNIASNAKQYTALCILKLVEEGKLKLDEDFRTYLPGFYTDITDKITLNQLLSHTSGIRDVYDLWALQGKTWWQQFINNGDALALLKEQASLNFEPGTEYVYSNSNYILLTAIVEKVTGTDFDVYTKELFVGMGMEQTSFMTNYMDVIPNRARPYGNWDGWKEYPSVSELHGDGALFTTLSDQLVWEQGIQKQEIAMLSADVLEKSQRPIHSTSQMTYGFGLIFDTYKGLAYAYHDGNTGAYNASFFRFPEPQLSVVLMSNNGNVPVHYLVEKTVDIVLGLEAKKHRYPSGPEKIFAQLDLSDMVGTYRNDEGTIISIEERNDTLYRNIYRRDPVALFQEKGSLFHYSTVKELKMAFEKNNGKVSGFTIYLSSQPPVTYTKLPSHTLNNDYLNSLQGSFYNAETKTVLKISHDRDKVFLIDKNGRERAGELLYKDFLRMNSYEIRMKRNENGQINGLTVKNGRIKNVVFEKFENTSTPIKSDD